MVACEVIEDRALLGDFCSDQRLPDALLRGQIGLDPCPMSLGLDVMGGEREHHARRQMISPRHHHRCPSSKQFEEHGLRIGGAGVIDDHDAQILDR